MTQCFHKSKKLLKPHVSFFMSYALISQIACSKRQSAQMHVGNVIHGFVPLGSVGKFKYMGRVYSRAEGDARLGPCPGWLVFKE